MPGITHAYCPDSKPTTRKSPSSPAVVPPYPFKTSTTAYGLNEPQWSIGPPPLTYARSPYASVPLPPLPLINLHEFLLYRDQNVSTITWPVHQPPTSARLVSTSAYTTAYHWKALPALAHDPRAHSSLTIRVASTPFTRPIVVVPANRDSGVITIGDVLNCVYSGLRQCANDVLCESMQISPSLFSEQLFRTYGFPQTTPSGPRLGPKQSNDEVSSHIAQILDFETQWDGLAPCERERDVLVLHTKALAPR